MSTAVSLAGRGIRGESAADVARRVLGLPVGTSDIAALKAAIEYAVTGDLQTAQQSAAIAMAEAAIATTQAGLALSAQQTVALVAGVSVVFATKAAMDAGIAPLAANAFILILADETHNGHKTVWQKQGAVGVFVADIDTLDRIAEDRGVNMLSGMKYWHTATAEVDGRTMVRQLANEPFGPLPRPTTTGMTLSQTGNVVTASAAFFANADPGRLIVFADGSEAEIIAVNTTGGVAVTTATVLQNATVAAQAARVQAKGPVWPTYGDSKGVQDLCDLVRLMYGAYGFGGIVCSPLGDSSQEYFQSAPTLAGGATAVLGVQQAGINGTDNGDFAAHAWGAYWLLPAGGSVAVGTWAADNGTAVPNDLPVEDVLSDTALIVWRRATGVLTVERRRAWDNAWETVATGIDASQAGIVTSGTIVGALRYKHTLGQGWQYRVTCTSGTVQINSIALLNRTTPGFMLWPFNEGGMIMGDSNTMLPATLKAYVDLFMPDLRTVQIKDGADLLAINSNRNPSLTSLGWLTADQALWGAAAPRTDTVYIGIQPDSNDATISDDTNENAVKRAFAIAGGFGYFSMKAAWTSYAASSAVGLYVDGIHSNPKGQKLGSVVADRMMDMTTSTSGRMSRQVHSYSGDFGRLRVRGIDVMDAIRKGHARAAAKDRGIRIGVSHSLVGAGGGAIGTADFTIAVKATLPVALTGNTTVEFYYGTATVASNTAGCIQFQLANGRVYIYLWNAAGTGYLLYQVDSSFLVNYAGKTGYIVLRTNRARDNIEVWFDTENRSAHLGTAPVKTAGGSPVSTEDLNAANSTPWTGQGSNLVVGGSADMIPLYGVAMWRSALTDAQIIDLALSDDPRASSPDVYYSLEEGAGRRVLDRSGNGHHATILGSPSYTLTAFSWVSPKQQLSPPIDATLVTTGVLLANECVIADTAALQVWTLPATPLLGDRVRVVGKGAGKWKVAQPAAHQIVQGAGAAIGTNATTAGTGGSMAAANRYDAVELECVTSDSVTPSYIWSVVSQSGALTWA